MDFTILAVVLLLGVGVPIRNKLIRKYRDIQTSASTAGKRKKPLTGRGFRALSCITDGYGGFE